MWNTREREESLVNLRFGASATQSIEFTLDEVRKAVLRGRIGSQFWMC